MIHTGIDKSKSRIRQSFGDWATESEFAWVNPAKNHRPAETTHTENKNIASRRAAAYWESRK